MNRSVHIALVKGALNVASPPLVRVQVGETLRDVVGVHGTSHGWPLRAALERIAADGNGVVVLLRAEESPRELIESVRALGPSSMSKPAVRVLRTYGIGAQILHDLGIRKMRVLSAPRQLQGLSAFDLSITEYVDAGVEPELGLEAQG